MNPFAKLHAGPDLLILPNAWDAGSARLIELAGAKAIATSSAAVAWAHGYPDGEALPFDVLLATVREIARVVSVPITADIEMAYGADGARAAEAVANVVEAGACGVNVEDGAAPPDLLVDKIATIRRRLGDRVWINARTDVYLKHLAEGEAAVEETIARGRRYREAGADSVFVPFLADEAVLARLVEAIPAPLNVLGPNLPPAARLKEIGIRRLSAGGGVAKLSFNRAFVAAQAFLADGRSDAFGEAVAVPGGFNAAMKRD
jgi:2-methylisocitrate lyase-like PEP mutase family enzyme